MQETLPVDVSKLTRTSGTPNGYPHTYLRFVSRQEISKLTLVDIIDEWK